MDRWGATELPSAVCPIPQAYTPDQALQAYLNAKKNMPGLSPAAWRKQAAIDLGMDYDTYLALWKVHKGSAKIAKALKIPLEPVSTPTLPASISSSPTMGIQAKAPLMTYDQLKLAVDIDSYKVKPVITTDYVQGDQVFKMAFQNSDDYHDVLEILDAGGMDYMAAGNIVKVFKKQPTAGSGQATAKMVADTKWKPKGASSQAKLDDIEDTFNDGGISADEAVQHLDELMKGASPDIYDSAFELKMMIKPLQPASTAKKVTAATTKKIAAKKAASKKRWKPNPSSPPAQKAKEIEAAFHAGKIGADEAYKYLDDVLKSAPDYIKVGVKGYVDQAKASIGVGNQAVIQTAHGPLTHELASNVYKVMKKNMPGATPAQLRHAAAEYLGVDYNDYLKAWKKPTTKAQAAAQTPASKLPPPTTTPLSPSSVGKYKNKDGVGPDELKADLARLYGPGAQPNYIALGYDDVTGAYTVFFPNSLLPTQAAKDAVVEGLKKLGLKVDKLPNGAYKIAHPDAAKKAAANAKQIKQTGTYTLPDGTVALDMTEANKWTDTWWGTLKADTKSAWGNYTGSGYIDINSYWRKGTTKHGFMSPEKIKEVSELLSKSMQTVKTEFTVFRGTNIDIDKFVKGKVWTDEGFVSTAINPGSSWSGVKFEIVLPKGTKGMYIGNRSSHPGENEFLIDRDTKFRILEVDKDKNKIKLIAIPKK
jgi:polyhydroxyalkanoate synthesis regulator phasin